MQIKSLTASIAVFFLSPFAALALQPTDPIPFSMGVDYSKICSEVDVRGACDVSNMVSDKQGSAFPRNGSERFIDQAFSTQPFTSLYHYNVSTGSTVRRGLIGVTGKYILHSTYGFSPRWEILSSSLATSNQAFEFVTIGNDVIGTGDALTDDIFKFNVMTSSVSHFFDTGTGSDSVKLRAKHITISRNYTLFGNVRDVRNALTGSTTDYPSRVYYSKLLQPSSITVLNFEDVGIENGEITKFSNKLGRTEVYQPQNVTEFSFTSLDPGAGDQDLTPIVDGFGLIAPGTHENIGIYDIGLSYEGVFRWDGGRRTRLEVSQEKDIISKPISPIIKRLIENNLYKKAVAKFYPKENWYVFCYEDSIAFPRGVNNSCAIFDLTIGQWYPQKNWLAASLEVRGGTNDDGAIFYGDSMDGYVHQVDVKTRADDSPKELSLDPMDSTTTWVNSSTSPFIHVEGTGAVRLLLSPAVLSSSITKVAIFNMGEWHDKTRVNKSDLLQFKVYPSSLSAITSIRIDLMVDDNENVFTNNFSSVVFTSSALTSGNTQWTTVSVALSSFPLNPNWLDLDLEEAPFADGFTFYGIRFVSTATGDASLTFDDVRLVQATDNLLSPFWLTPHLNTSGFNKKDYKELILLSEKPRDSNLKIGVLTDYGNTVKTLIIPQEVPKEITLLGFAGIGGAYTLDSRNFQMIRSTKIENLTETDYSHGVADKKYFYLSEHVKNSIVKIARTSMTVIVSSFGTLGSGATSFNFIHQVSLDADGDIWLVENGNHRIKELSTDLKIKRVFGELGRGTTNYHSPTGITADRTHIWVADGGNSRIVQQTQEDGLPIVGTIPLDLNTIGEASLANDSENLYLGYNKLDLNKVYFQDVVLEKREKSTRKLILRKVLRPEGVVASSTYAILGDISIEGPYIFVTFAEDITSGNFSYYTQKLLREDFSLVSQLKQPGIQFGPIGDGQSFLPEFETRQIPLNLVDAVYVQFKYFSDELEPKFRLIGQSLVPIEKPFTTK